MGFCKASEQKLAHNASSRFTHNAVARYCELVADQVPPTQKGQIDALLSALGFSDFHAATAAIPQLRASAESATNWQAQRQGLFALLGGTGDVPATYDFAAAINGLRSDRNAIFGLVSATDQAGAVAAIGNLQTQVVNLSADRQAIFDALKVTDKGAALTAITDIEGRVKQGVIQQAAAAGLQAPVPKVPGAAEPGANTMSRADFNAMAPSARKQFSLKGGRLTD